MWLICRCLTMLWILCAAESAKILGVFYSPGLSHFMAGSTLMDILANRGHEVTVLSPFSRNDSIENYEEIYLDGLVNKTWGRSASLFRKRQNPFLLAMMANKLSAPFLGKFMSHPKFRGLINGNRTFDLVIVEEFASEALFYLGPYFEAPVIGFSTIGASQWTNRYVGNPTFPASIPDILLPFDRMNYWERLENTLIYLLQEILFYHQRIPAQEEILKAHFPQAPRLEEFIYNVSLTFLNADPCFHSPIPKVPSMIDIGGFHINPAKALPDDLQQILDNSTNGVIYFSMGSSITSSKMPKEKLDAFIEVFSKLKEKVLWKWENESSAPNLENVIARRWFPQQDILRHKHVKLFITHGGLLSMMESIFNGVPMLTIPIKADQFYNSARGERGAFSKSVDFLEITEFSLNSSITELLENKTYTQNAKKQSRIMRLKQTSSRETLVFWTEYVIEFRGAQHLRVSSLDMAWYQYMLLDVIPIILLPLIMMLIATIFLTYYTVKLIIRFYGECDSTKNIMKSLHCRWKLLQRFSNKNDRPREEVLQLLSEDKKKNPCVTLKPKTQESDL